MAENKLIRWFLLFAVICNSSHSFPTTVDGTSVLEELRGNVTSLWEEMIRLKSAFEEHKEAVAVDGSSHHEDNHHHGDDHHHGDNHHHGDDHHHDHEEHANDLHHGYADHTDIHDSHHSHDYHDYSHDEHSHDYDDHSHGDHDHSHEDHDHSHDGHDHSHEEDHDHSHDDHDHSHEDHDHSHEEDHDHSHEEDHDHSHEDHDYSHDDPNHSHEQNHSEENGDAKMMMKKMKESEQHHGHHHHQHHHHEKKEDDMFRAHCHLEPNVEEPSSKVNGHVTIKLKKDGKGPLYFKLNIKDFDVPADGSGRVHGFHIHENKITDGKCSSAGPHFNPVDLTHGAPLSDTRHVGDLGNIKIGGEGKLTNYLIKDTEATFGGKKSVLGRSIVVHALPDDLGLGGDEESLKTGNAGARLACCTIEGENLPPISTTAIRFNG